MMKRHYITKNSKFKIQNFKNITKLEEWFKEFSSYNVVTNYLNRKEGL